MGNEIGKNRRFEIETKDEQERETAGVSESSHSIFCAASQLQGKWRVAILCVLKGGPVRLGELSRRIPDASKKMLMTELKSLVLAGLVVRRDLTGNRPVRHVEYSIAKPIESATIQLLRQLEEWNRAARAIAGRFKPEHPQ